MPFRLRFPRRRDPRDPRDEGRRFGGGRRAGRGRRLGLPGLGAGKGRLLVALLVAGIAFVGYLTSTQTNPVTGEKQRVALTVDQEIRLGLEAAPQMVRQHGGLHPDPQKRALLQQIGERLVARTVASKSPYEFQFHLLADDQMVNAFALPGGQIFMTHALFRQLTTEGQLAGVLGHEIGHVIERHGAEHAAKAKLSQGLTGAAVMATYDPANPSSQGKAAIAQLVLNVVNMKFGRDDELESDKWGVQLMANAGYDPRSLIAVMEVLAQAGGGKQPEFFSTHPNPENRKERIADAIRAAFPNGVPEGLIP